MRKAAVVLFTVGCGVGCGSGNGEPVGVFTVTGELAASCVDEGLLAAPPTFEARAWLRRVGETALHWDDGTGRMIGSYHATSREFVVGRNLIVDLRQGDESLPSCVANRHQIVSGKLDAEPTLATAFAGELLYEYTLQDGSSCADLPSDEAGVVAALPCTVSYGLTGLRD
jgi:hypothetical protein